METFLCFLLLSILQLVSLKIETVDFDQRDNALQITATERNLESINNLIIREEEDLKKKYKSDHLEAPKFRNINSTDKIICTTSSYAATSKGLQIVDLQYIFHDYMNKGKLCQKNNFKEIEVTSYHLYPKLLKYVGAIDHKNELQSIPKHNFLQSAYSRSKRSNTVDKAVHNNGDIGRADAAKTGVKLYSVDQRNSQGLTPLYQAVVNDHTGIADQLVSAGADLNRKFFVENRNLLHEAARLGAVKSIRWLVEKGLGVNSTDDVARTPLHYAVRSGQINAAKTLIDLKSCLDCKDRQGVTPLYEALVNGHIYIANVLVKAGADVQQTISNDHKNLLHNAAALGDVNSIGWLVKNGIYVNATDDDKWTPLHYAAHNGRLNATITLLELRCCIDCRNSAGLTALYKALAVNKIEIAAVLVKAGADLLQKITRDHRNLLHDAAALGAVDSIRWLVGNGIDVNATDDDKWTPLHYAAHNGRLNATITLLELRCCIDCRNSAGLSALYKALAVNKIEIAAVLVKAGADLQQKITRDHRTLLHGAAALDAVDSIRWLVGNGIDVNATDDDKWTPMHYAARNGRLNATITLLDLKCCIDCRNSAGTTALYKALEHKNIDIADTLVDAGADLLQTFNNDHKNLLHVAATLGYVDSIQWLVKKGLYINATDDGKWTPLHYAAHNGRLNATITLLELRCCIDCRNSAGITPLAKTLPNNNIDIAAVLVKAGADLQQKITRDHRNLLHEAASLGAVNSIRWLVENGIDVNATDKDKWTPLHYAAHNGRLNATITLLELRCCIDCRNLAEYTALYKALEIKNTEIAAVLVKAGADLQQKVSKDHKNLLHEAARMGAVKPIRWLVENGIHINATDDDKWTPLHYAAHNGRLNATITLINLKCCVDCRNSAGLTPLAKTLPNNSIDIAAVLVKAGADLHQTFSSDHRNLLHEAAALDAVNSIRWLVKNGISVNSTEDFTWMPLHFAARNGKLNATKVLVELNSCVDCKSREGFTPLRYAEMNHHQDVVKYLKSI